jgi:tRNA(Ile)-lysidine synthase TilS/MesJ
MEGIVEGYVKPMMPFRKQQLRDYVALNQLEWREDSSNQLKHYKRNAVRLDLMPLLVELAGGETAISKRWMALSEQSAELQSWVDTEVSAT